MKKTPTPVVTRQQKSAPAVSSPRFTPEFPSSWLENPRLSLTSPETDALLGELMSITEAVRTVVETATQRPGLPNAGSVGFMLSLFTSAMKNLVSLKTLCRAAESVSPASSAAADFRQRVVDCEKALEGLAGLCADSSSLSLVIHTQPDAETLAYRTFLAHQKAAQSQSPLRAKILPTVSGLYRHAMSTMRLSLTTSTRQTLTVSYSQAVQILKSATDPVLRKSAFQATNAWCAERSTQFADILNLTLATNLDRLSPTETLSTHLSHALTNERISRRTYEALFTALESSLPSLQETVLRRARALGEAKLHASLLLAPGIDGITKTKAGSPTAHELPLSTYQGAVSTLKAAYAPLDTGFSRFVEVLESEHWIDAEHHSGKVGGTWCENFPTMNRVVIFANFSQGLAGALQLAHPLAVGYLFYSINLAQTHACRLPYSVLEVAGQLGVLLLMRYAKRTQAGENASTLTWGLLSQLTNRLLLLPMRHQLMKALIERRQKGDLRTEEINAATRDTWQAWFGDTVENLDQYLWAMKPHFFRVDRLFYDWQYTFGFLLAQRLLQHWMALPEEDRASALQRFFVESTAMPFEPLVARHLEENIDTVSFWHRAIAEVLQSVDIPCVPIVPTGQKR